MVMLTIGHRGACGHIAENTLESIKKAIDLGAGGIEIDVRACKTGELVVIHDDTLNRTTYGTGFVKNHTLQELSNIKVAGKYKIPTLEEVIRLTKNKKFLNIEIKETGISKPLIDVLLDSYGQIPGAE